MSVGDDAKAKEARDARRAARRIFLTGGVFAAAMAAATFRLGYFASTAKSEGGAAPERFATSSIAPGRAEIVDRRGLPLVGNAPTYEIYLDRTRLPLPEDQAEAADRIAALFPEHDREALLKKIKRRRTTTIRRPATPLDAKRAQDLGIPGLYRKLRTDRVYFGGRSTAHVLGYVDLDGKGLAGVEGALDKDLVQERAKPLRLSLDLRVQRQVWEILGAAMVRYRARAAAGVVLNVATGEVAALVSLPDFDPHRRDEVKAGPGADSPFYNWAVSPGAEGYEPGSTMKLVTWALALESGVAQMGDTFRPPKEIEVEGASISDHDPFGELSFPMALAKSSNVVAADLALRAGAEKQRALFEALGLMEPSGIEVQEARAAKPVWHADWRPSSTATTAFGHGVQLSPLQIAEMAATLVGGGERVKATLIADPSPPAYRTRAISKETSAHMREMMRLVVTSGTGRSADVEGLEVGGKTGTSEKVIKGRYVHDRVVSSFVAAFPMRAPRYVVLVMLDEPTAVTSGGKEVHYASYTAAPTAGEVIRTIAPLLGVAPQ